MKKISIVPKPHRWSAWSAWIPTVREIAEDAFPHLPTLAEALRGDEPVPEQVRKFLADLVEGKATKVRGKGAPKKANVIEQQFADDFLHAVYEDELARIKALPRKERDRGTPTDLALLATAKAAAKNKMRNHDGKLLSPDAINKRLRNRDRPKRK